MASGSNLDLSGFYGPPTDFKELGELAQILQQNKARKDEMDYRKRKEEEAKAQQNSLYNLREIDQDTDATKFKTGEERFDNYTQKELSKLENKFLTEYVNLNPAEAKFRIGKDMQDFIGWYTSVKSKIDNTKAGLVEFNKTYPNTNIQKAHDISFLNIANDYLEKDKDGNLIRKDPSLVKHRDYVAELNTPDNLTEIVDDVTPFSKYIQSFKPQKIGAKEYTSKKGHSVKHAYTGEVTPFSEVEVNEDGKATGVKLKSEDFKYDGGTLKMLPEDQFEQMMQVPQVRSSIIGMWGKEKKNFEQVTGTKINPANEDKMLRGFLYDQIKDNNLDQHYFKTDDAVVTPKTTNVTNINLGAAQINDIFSTIDDAATKSVGQSNWPYNEKLEDAEKVQNLKLDASNLIVDFVNKSYPDKGASEKPYKASDLFVKKNTDGSVIVLDVEGNNLGTLPKTGTNLKAQPGIKEKREVIKEGKKKTYKGLDKNGNPIFE